MQKKKLGTKIDVHILIIEYHVEYQLNSYILDFFIPIAF